mgnify:CR=1 FL=1
MTYEMYRYIFIIGLILCIVMLAVSVILFFVLHVPQIIGDLSGSTARKAIQNIREKNEAGGDKAYKTSVVNQRRGKLTDRISPSGRIDTRTRAPLAAGVVTAKIATQQMPSADETTLLEPQGAAVYSGQADVTTLLDGYALSVDFEIETDITYIHTETKIRS